MVPVVFVDVHDELSEKDRMETVGSLSTLALVASGGYLGAGAAAFAAAIVSRGKRRAIHQDRIYPVHHRKGWSAVGCSFILFFAMRLLQVEDRLRSSARSMLMEARGYSDRWDLQAPASALVVMAVAAVMLVIWLGRGQRSAKASSLPFALLLAFSAVGAMLVLIVLRLVSLHAIDSVLYRGPHLNWVLDTGSTLVAFSAGVFTVVRGPQPRRHAKTASRGHS